MRRLRFGAAPAAPALVFVATIGAALPAVAEGPVLGPVVKMFVGKVRTMDGDRVAEAVGVDARGLIVAVGTEKEVLAKAKGTSPAVTRLAVGQALLPGFFDAHQHVTGLLLQHSGLVELVGPCRPGPYHDGDPENCNSYIQETFRELRKKIGREKSNTFVVGTNLDPSRQWYDQATSSEAFKASPAEYIEKDLSAERPILLIDQSGHFGYVNHAAFDALRDVLAPDCSTSKSCSGWPPALGDGGEWDLKKGCTPKGADDTSCYTGLLTEIPGYNPFFQAVGIRALADFHQDPSKYVEGLGAGVSELLGAFRRAGLTTITSMAQSELDIAATRKLAELEISGTRMVSVVPAALAAKALGLEPIRPACVPTSDPSCRLPKDLGVSGIKTIVDGSTQGCTAAMQPPVLYRTALEGSECSPPEGRINYPIAGDLRKELAPAWMKGTWRFEAHANGNRALDVLLSVLASLQRERANPHTATVIHATVGDEKVWAKARALRTEKQHVDGMERPPIDLRFTHLIGHVAYWGDVFRRQLGAAAADDIDPTLFDHDHGIPFSFHSDGPVSVPMPLWFVRQAVTRETWSYPKLELAGVLGHRHRISVLEALRAITIRTAQEKELDAWLGSIEVGKVADFVVLSADPVLFDPHRGGDPTKITDIEVVATYLGGEKTGPR